MKYKYFVFQNDLLFDTSGNDRLWFQEYKQKLVFKFTVLEDNGSYTCKVLNELGSDTSIYKLIINGE